MKRRTWNQKVMRRLWKKAKGRCRLCSIRLSVCVYGGKSGIHTSPCFPHVDHIVPLARGGPDTEENLQLLCRPCNLRKGARA